MDQFDHQGRFANSLPWEVRPCENPIGWTTVGYIRRGPHHGTFIPRHHWADRRDAELHVTLLNRGLDCGKAHAMVMSCIHEVEG